MFRESLLESSPDSRGKKRWPMATAFVAELVVAAVLVLIPLFSSGIIPLSARAPQPPLRIVPMAEPEAKPTGGNTSPAGPHMPTTEVQELPTHGNQITIGPTRPAGPGDDVPLPKNFSCIQNCTSVGPPIIGELSGPPALRKGPLVISRLSQAQLINRVEPVYPRTASLIHLQGVVQLHALIAKDGTIQSLSVMSGHPLLAAAALDAVRQWRYRPYLLNNEPVEVETFITVTFKRTGD